MKFVFYSVLPKDKKKRRLPSSDAGDKFQKLKKSSAKGSVKCWSLPSNRTRVVSRNRKSIRRDTVVRCL